MKITVLEKLFNQNPSLDDIIRECIQKAKNEDAFYVCDVSDLLRKHKAWMTQLPRVRPFYAVKCNSAPIVLETLSSLGIGFDCASKVHYRARVPLTSLQLLTCCLPFFSRPKLTACWTLVSHRKTSSTLTLAKPSLSFPMLPRWVSTR